VCYITYGDRTRLRICSFTSIRALKILLAGASIRRAWTCICHESPQTIWDHILDVLDIVLEDLIVTSVDSSIVRDRSIDRVT